MRTSLTRGSLVLVALASALTAVTAQPAVAAPCPGADPCPYIGTPSVVGKFGRTGFNGPSGLSIVTNTGSDTRLYVTDYNNSRIIQLGNTGAFVRGFGKGEAGGQAGTLPGELYGAAGATVDPGNIADPGDDLLYVADAFNNRVSVFDADNGDYLAQIGSGTGGNGANDVARPVDVGVNPTTHNIYVAEQTNNRIHEFTAAGANVGTFAANYPRGVVSDGTKIWVAEEGLGRVSRYATGTYAYEASTAVNVVNDPYGVSFDPNGTSLWVADGYRNRVVKINRTTLAFEDDLGGTFGSGDGQFYHPQDAEVGPCGGGGNCLYIVDSYNNRLQKFALPSKAFSAKFETAGLTGLRLNSPWGLAASPNGTLWVADRDNNRIVNFDPQTGDLVASPIGRNNGFGGPPSNQPGEFNGPFGLSVDPCGATDGGGSCLYVADRNNHRVQKFTLAGAYIRGYGNGYGNDPGELNLPEGIAAAPDGTVYIADTYNYRVSVFAPNGSFLRSFGRDGGTSGSGEGAFVLTTDTEIDADGNVWVVDFNNSRVQLLTPTGAFLRAFGGPAAGAAPGSFSGPRFADVDAFDQLVVGDSGNGRFQVLDAKTGGGAVVWGQRGDDPGQINELQGIALLPSGDLGAVDIGNHRVQTFDLPAPGAVTGAAASAIGLTTATVGATVDANGGVAQWRVDYGPTAAYGARVAGTTGPGTGTQAIATSLTGLHAATTYHYRVTAATPAGSQDSGDHTFTTAGLAVGVAGAAGAAGANGAAGAAGAQGAAGATGPRGPAGAAGRSAVVTCKVVKPKKKKARAQCTVKLSRAAGVRASLRRAGRVVARASSTRRVRRHVLTLPARAGRYTLRLALTGGEVLDVRVTLRGAR